MIRYLSHHWKTYFVSFCLFIGISTVTLADTLQATANGSEEKTISLENIHNIYGFSITANIDLHNNANSVAKVILIDSQQREHLVYESYSALSKERAYTIQQVCEETCVFEQPLTAIALRLEVENATINLQDITYLSTAPDLPNRRARRDSLKKEQDLLKIQKLNAQNLGWVAGETSVSQLSYEEKKRLFLNGKVPTNLQGFEYYSGGIFEIKSEESSQDTRRDRRASSRFPVVSNFSWLNRHGKNWVTPVKNQGQCGSCWAFATVGVLESLMNTYYNRLLNLDLSEQELLSCSGAGNCGGGKVDTVFNYTKNRGVVEEACFGYKATESLCSNKCSNPENTIKPYNHWYTWGGYVMGETQFNEIEGIVKRLIIEKGSIAGTLRSLNHVMTLVGFEKDNNDGRTVWIFKNSWGDWWGENPLRTLPDGSNWGTYQNQSYSKAGYAYVKFEMDNLFFDIMEQPIVDSRKSYSINCVDEDNDGLCNWGLSKNKPATCPSSCKAQKDCDDSNPNVGSFAVDYSCRNASEMTKTQPVTIKNTGTGSLSVSSISTNVNWVKIVESTQFQIEPNTSKIINIQVDYGQVPVGQNAVTLMVNSNDPATPSSPINIVVQQAEEFTPMIGGSSAAASTGISKTSSSFTGRVSLPTKATADAFTVSTSNPVNISGQIFVDPAHIGKTANIFVLVIYGGKNQMLTPAGLLDFNPVKLSEQHFMSGVKLENIQHISMYSGNLPPIGQIKIHFGYQLQGTSEILYNSTPMNIEVKN